MLEIPCPTTQAIKHGSAPTWIFAVDEIMEEYHKIALNKATLEVILIKPRRAESTSGAVEKRDFGTLRRTKDYKHP